MGRNEGKRAGMRTGGRGGGGKGWKRERVVWKWGGKRKREKQGRESLGRDCAVLKIPLKRPSSGPSLALTVSSIWLICNVRFLRATAHKCYSVYMYMPRQFRLSVRLSHA